MVGTSLLKMNPNLHVTYHFQEAIGDKDLKSPLWKMPGKGVFTRDLQEELLKKNIDCIVHSWKDLDLEEREETDIISVLPREDQRDLLLLKRSTYKNPPTKLVFCTSSPRREYNLSKFFSTHLPLRFREVPIEFESIRGNVQTRIKRFLEGNYSGLIIAKAALDRLLSFEKEYFVPGEELQEFLEVSNFIRKSLKECLFSVLPLSCNPNAPAQGALAVEILKSDFEKINLFSKLTDVNTSSSTIKERKILSHFGGGCHQKIGVAVQKYSYGEVCFLRGLSDSGKILETSDVLQEIDENYITNIQNDLKIGSNNQFYRNEIWPPGGIMALRKRNRLQVSIPENKDIFVTRGYALPENTEINPEKNILWVAGTGTWKELADRDLWVHGSFDSLGETNLEPLSSLLDRSPDFMKLTHSESREDSIFPTLFTYSVGEPLIPENFDPSTIKAVFWRSGTEFDSVTKKFPSLKNLPTFCGVGSTYKHLLNDPVIQNHKKLYIYLSFKDWIKKCTI